MREIEIVWFAPENTDATATLKQHCFRPIHWVSRYSNTGYLANTMLCGMGHMADDVDRLTPWDEVESEPFREHHACKKCIKAYRKLFGKDPS